MKNHITFVRLFHEKVVKHVLKAYFFGEFLRFLVWKYLISLKLLLEMLEKATWAFMITLLLENSYPKVVLNSNILILNILQPKRDTSGIER